MEKYLSIRAQTALYMSVFFISLHYVFVYLANSSMLTYVFNLKTSEVLSIYGIASLFGICVYLSVLKYNLVRNTKKSIYVAALIEMLVLASMYYFTTYLNKYAFIALFSLHHILTPYILFNLDVLFEAYTHIKDRGKSRGIYLTVWNIPFIVVPMIMSTLSLEKLHIVYIVSATLLFPFLYLIFFHIKNPENDNLTLDQNTNVMHLLRKFFSDKLDRKSFLINSSLFLYYGSIAVLLPLYLHSVFAFDWDRIGLILAVMTAPFVLIQIPFGNIEDRRHNEKTVFRLGLFITVLFTICALLVSPTLDPDISFVLLMTFMFLSYIGTSLIEIALESTFYKHVTERDTTALLMFRSARIFPYLLALLAILFIRH